MLVCKIRQLIIFFFSNTHKFLKMISAVLTEYARLPKGALPALPALPRISGTLESTATWLYVRPGSVEISKSKITLCKMHCKSNSTYCRCCLPYSSFLKNGQPQNKKKDKFSPSVKALQLPNSTSEGKGRGQATSPQENWINGFVWCPHEASPSVGDVGAAGEAGTGFRVIRSSSACTSERTGFWPDFLADGGKPLLPLPAPPPGLPPPTPGPPGEPVFLLNKLLKKFARTPSLVAPAFMFGSIFFAPAGIGDTLATLDDTDRFGVRGEPPGTLGEASTGLPAAVGGCFAKRDWKKKISV